MVTRKKKASEKKKRGFSIPAEVFKQPEGRSGPLSREARGWTSGYQRRADMARDQRVGVYFDENVYQLMLTACADRRVSKSFALEEAVIDWIRKVDWEAEEDLSALEDLLDVRGF